MALLSFDKVQIGDTIEFRCLRWQMTGTVTAVATDNGLRKAICVGDNHWLSRSVHNGRVFKKIECQSDSLG